MIRPDFRLPMLAAMLLLPVTAAAQTTAPDSTAAAVAPPVVARAPSPDSAAAGGAGPVDAPTTPSEASAVATGAPAAPVLVSTAFRPLAAGDQVRVRSAAGRYHGTLTQVTADTITLAAPGRMDAVLRSDVSEVHRLVSREPRGRSILRGAAFGLLAGAALGFVGGTAAGDNDCAEGNPSCTRRPDKTAQVAFTADGAVLGALFGAMIGPTFRRARWERVDARPMIGVAIPPPASADTTAASQSR